MDLFSACFQIIFGLVTLPFLGIVVIINLAITLVDYCSIKKSHFQNKARAEFEGARKRLLTWILVFLIVTILTVGPLIFVAYH